MPVRSRRARRHLTTALGAAAAVSTVAAAAVASPAPADAPYVIVAWSAVAFGAAVLVVAVGREDQPERPRP